MDLDSVHTLHQPSKLRRNRPYVRSRCEFSQVILSAQKLSFLFFHEDTAQNDVTFDTALLGYNTQMHYAMIHVFALGCIHEMNHVGPVEPLLSLFSFIHSLKHLQYRQETPLIVLLIGLGRHRRPLSLISSVATLQIYAHISANIFTLRVIY